VFKVLDKRIDKIQKPIKIIDNLIIKYETQYKAQVERLKKMKKEIKLQKKRLQNLTESRDNLINERQLKQRYCEVFEGIFG
jgi:hypothetical protein